MENLSPFQTRGQFRKARLKHRLSKLIHPAQLIAQEKEKRTQRVIALTLVLRKARTLDRRKRRSKKQAARKQQIRNVRNGSSKPLTPCKRG